MTINDLPREKKGRPDEVIAITFDGGPEPGITQRILGVLAEHGAKCTFFLEGKKVDAHPDLAKMIFDQGHDLGNHTYSHPRLTELTRMEIEKEILDTNTAIERATGFKPVLFRPPWGDWDLLLEEILLQLGMKMILWSYGTDDWRVPDPNIVAGNFVHRAYHRAIAIFHQHPHVPEALSAGLPSLIEKGYQFVPVSELIKHRDGLS